MKKVTVCLVCYQCYVDGVYASNATSLTKLMLTAKYTPDLIQVLRYICPNCRIFLSEQEQGKILKEGG